METRATDVAGLLLVDKPAGVTSHDVVALVRRAMHTKRAGHAGTLDPFATGLLVLLIGRGTRLIQYIDGDPKVYEATIAFGTETDTDDLTGAVTREAPPPAMAAILEALSQLIGPIQQVPPAYSAKKVDGQRAYSAARKGAPLDLQPVEVVVHQWSVLEHSETHLTARITCNGGTYIRALARDLGRLSNSAAHLTALRRTNSGRFSVAEAATLEQLGDGAFTLRPLRAAIPDMPVQQLDDAEYGRVLHGNPVSARTDGSPVALLDHEETLIAVAERNGDMLNPTLVLRDG